MTIYRDFLGGDPRATFLLAVVGKKHEDFKSPVEVLLVGDLVVVNETIEQHRFRIPKRWHTDVSRMEDILTSGMSYELEQHIATVLGDE